MVKYLNIPLLKKINGSVMKIVRNAVKILIRSKYSVTLSRFRYFYSCGDNQRIGFYTHVYLSLIHI